MGFNHKDAEALRVAAENHLPAKPVEAGDQNCVMKIQVGPMLPAVSDDEAAAILAAAIRAATRFFNHSDSTTTWLDVQTPSFPAFIVPAIRECVGFGLGLVITHNDACSHPPGRRLPDEVLAAMVKSQRDGRIWHPIACRLVWSSDDLPQPEHGQN